MKASVKTNALWEDTRDLHHACEYHPVGAAMAAGTPTQQQYADWLQTLYLIHDVLDPEISPVLHRAERCHNDVQAMPVPGRTLKAAQAFVDQLKADSHLRAGTAYVLSGAHLMGGEIMRRKLIGFPTTHLLWDDRQKSLKELGHLRDQEGITEPARACFKALLGVLDEMALA